MMRRLLKVLKYTFLGLFICFLVLAIVLRMRYGGGHYYPNLMTEPILPKTALETVFSFPEPLGNIAVSANNRIFFTVHPESRPGKNKVMEIVDGEAIPYPSATFQDKNYQTVLGLCIDEQHRLWTIDHGNHGFGKTRLMAFDLPTNTLVHDHVFPTAIAERGSFFNDLQVSPDGKTVYIADVSFFGKNPALVVYDVTTQQSRRLLEKHSSVYPKDYIIRNPSKDMTFLGGLIALKPGIDGIVIDRKGDYVYYGAMTHDGLFKVRTSDLKEESLAAADLEERVIRIGKKPLSDGLSIDTLDNVYITDVENGGLARMSAMGQLKTLITDTARVRWADGCSFGGDGYLYFTDSAIPDQMLRSKRHMKNKAPYFIYRVNPGIGGIPGR